MYQIKPVTDNKIWNEFQSKLNKNTFLHSNQWADFNSETNKVWKLGLYDNQNTLISIALVILIVAKRGRFLLIPHGPQYSIDKKLDFEGTFNLHYKILDCWTKYLKTLGKENHCSFIRIQPILSEKEIHKKVFKKIGFKPAPIHMHTELSSVLDLTNQQDLLLKMRKTTRQMIKKGEKMVAQGEIKILYPTKITQEMHEVYTSTYKRGGATAYSKEYIEKEWRIFSKNNKARLISVVYQDKVISWGLVLLSGRRAFYHQGGNIIIKGVPGSYLVQWEGIKFALENQCITYDFWGVSPVDKPDHPWANISLFKRGFGGNDLQLVHAQDFIINWKYWFNWIIETRRAKKRGFKN